MSAKDVIVLNSHGIGQYAYCDHMPVLGESLSVKNWHIAEDGGKGSNVAVALGRLGVLTAYIGKVGYDPWGDLGEKWMRDAGVDVTYLYRSHEISTGTGLVLLGPDGQNTVIDGEGSSRALTEEEILNALEAMKGSSWLVTGFEIPTHLALFAAQYAKKLGMKTALNPSPFPKEKVGSLKYIDYLFINEVEGRYMCGKEKSASVDPVQLTNEIRDLYGIRNIVMTMGSNGSFALCGNDIYYAKPVSVANVVNTAGAGDGYMASVIACLIKGMKMQKAMNWSSAYAALSVTINGTIPSYRYPEEVEAFIAEHK